ncbi:MAG: NTP transferase domain-containing protein [Nitrososphaerota archaeon]
MLYGILLAGGLSERFGEDKYLWRIQDKPLISIPANAARSISDKILLLVRSYERASQLLEELRINVDGFILDDPSINCSGPLRGMLTALFTVEADEYLIIPGDMPWIDGRSLKCFVDICRSSNVDCGSIIWGNGSLSSTIQYFTKNARRNLGIVRELRGIYGRATDTFRGCNKILLAHVKNITSEPKKFIGVNFREEISNPQVPPVDGAVKDNIYLESSDPSFLRALAAENSREIDIALKMYGLEAEQYLSLNIYHLALHALMDVKRCLTGQDPKIDLKIQKCVNELKWNKAKRHIPG